ncbi:MAG TPA: type II toxin-antitoxin system VapC family toxin [Rhizomicrobium sp.]|jgi:ribonuclease VapC|nr:type II toxin-antitoxin system VapC family toxin [Rhizomicrobium sp.]
MIVIDSSAVIAILLVEPLTEVLTKRMVKEGIGALSMSAATYLEVGTVLAGRLTTTPSKAIDILDDFLSNWGVDLIPVDAQQARIALKARIVYGRGFRSGAQLNYGDCFSYALAKSLSAPLLYVGSDFDKTDIASALKG